MLRVISLELKTAGFSSSVSAVVNTRKSIDSQLSLGTFAADWSAGFAGIHMGTGCLMIKYMKCSIKPMYLYEFFDDPKS
jgi:hypothetical protein